MRGIRTERDLDGLRRGAQAYAVVAAWGGAGLFEALAGAGTLTAEELPGDTRAIRITAPMLTHLGLLRYDGLGWALSRAGRALWDDGTLGFGNARAALGDYSRLDAVLADGGPVRGEDGRSRVTEGGVREQDEAGARAFLAMLHRRAGSAADVADAVMRVLPEGAHVLDLGGGHGRYAHELVQRGARATLFDRPVIVGIARERYGESLAYLGGDFQVDDLGEGYDGALLSNIVHGLGPDENRDLLRRLAAALVPGGLLVFKDLFMDDLRSHPDDAAFFGLTMLMYTREGQAYSIPEMRDLCEDSGFEDVRWQLFPDDGYTLVTARRRAG